MNGVKVDKKVRIAILDTGIDLHHPCIKGKISVKNCWDFVGNSPEIRDDIGHGTHTAHLLVQTAPRAEIFCGRVWENRNEGKATSKLVADVRYSLSIIVTLR